MPCGGSAAVGFAGANVTIPHKEAVVELCDELDEVARRAGSVNTLVIRDGRVHGSSTDGLAVTTQIEARGRRALVLGTGGAAKAVAAALEEAGAEVVVHGRRDPGWPPSAEGFDVLVNATPVKDELIVAPRAGMQVVDLAYLRGRPPDRADRRRAGARLPPVRRRARRPSGAGRRVVRALDRESLRRSSRCGPRSATAA